MIPAPGGVSLRPFLPSDGDTLIEIFRAAIAQIAIEEYSEEQCLAWAQAAEDEAGFIEKLGQNVTLVAMKSGKIASFISLEANGTIALLYTSPPFARQGIATYLCAAVELLAQGRKMQTLKVEASDCAQTLLAMRGFVPMQRNSKFINGQWLTNTLMQKSLEPEATASTTQH